MGEGREKREEGMEMEREERRGDGDGERREERERKVRRKAMTEAPKTSDSSAY